MDVSGAVLQLQQVSRVEVLSQVGDVEAEA